MKNAKTMFEELGYREIKRTKTCIRFENNDLEVIEFEDICKDFIKVACGCDATPINMQELQAINQMCKELGWLDE